MLVSGLSVSAQTLEKMNWFNEPADWNISGNSLTMSVTPKSDSYRTISEKYKENTVKAVEDFFDFVFVEMNNAFNFDKNFGLKTSALKAAHEVAKKDLNTFLDKGIAQRQEETEEDDVIEETFFFYPIKGVLQSMSNEIYKILKGQ